MKRSGRMWQGLAVLAVSVMVFPSMQASAAEVAAPSGALASGTTFVMWADVKAMNKEDVGAAMQAMIAAAPESERERMTTKFDDQMAKMQPMFDAAAQLEADGVESGVLTMVPQADPGAQPKTQMFLKAKPGSDPKAAITKAAKAMNAWVRENEPGEAIDDEELAQKIDATELVKVNDDWYAVMYEDENVAPLPDAASAADPAPFIEAMNKEDGAPMRFAFVMTDQMKQQVQQAAASPNAAMMAGLIQPLADMQTATGGLWLGATPKLRISMNFGQEANATAFKTSADGMVQFMGQMMAMQAAQQDPNANPGQGPDMQKIQAVLPLMMLDREGSSVTKTLDMTLLEKLTEAGIPWYEGN